MIRRGFAGALTLVLCLFANVSAQAAPALKASSSQKPGVYLTFDDGPSPTYTPQILQVLAENDVKATFFMVGQNVERYPDTVKAAHAAGMSVQNHSWDHAYMNELPPRYSAASFLQTSDSIERITGQRPQCFRPPYGLAPSQTPSEVSKTVMWAIDPSDWSKPGAAEIARRTLAEVRNGYVILLHDSGGSPTAPDSRDQTVQALRLIIPELKARGFEFKTQCQ